jgi:predicted membrane protein
MGHEVRRNTNTRKTWGVLLVLLGGLLIANAFDLLPYRLKDIIWSWEMLLIVVGIFSLLNNQSKVLGIVLISLGGFFLIENYWDFPYYVRKAFWPSVVVVFGLYLIFSPPRYFRRRNRDKDNDSGESRDFIDEVSIFGGGERVVTSNEFKGGKTTSIFGGSKINLMNSQLAKGENIIDTFSVFGGTTLIVPAGWNVRVEVASIFGGFSDKRERMPNLVFDQDRVLVIKGLAIFGGGEIKSFGL